MKFIWSILVAITLVAFTSLNLRAQQPAPSRPAAPATQPSTAGTVPEGKIAIIDTVAFADPKTGITRLIRAFDVLEKEFRPHSDQLQKLRAQLDQLGKEIEAMSKAAVVDQRTIATKTDQAATLKKEIERRSQDAQDLYKRRLREVTEPVYKDIGPALQAYARQRGISVVFDVSKLSEVMFVVNESVDLTKAFIADYNQRNPGTAAPTTP
ncbi:MAG: OmpH family outer membrane protein [Pyrinomonadaceae bacterium]